MSPPTEVTCRLVEVAPNGAPIVEIDGEARLIELEGVELVRPLPAEYFELLQRIAKLGKPLCCTFAAEPGSRPNRAALLFYGWQDKSGDVWLDLAETLLQQGLARPADS